MTIKKLRGSLGACIALASFFVFAVNTPVLAGPVEKERSRTRIIFEEEEPGSKIEGNVHRPEVSYIISRPELEDEEILKLKESFLQKIIDSVNDRAFD
jgi:hypothetical protein